MKIELRGDANINELAKILFRLRETTKHWEYWHGAEAKNAKKYWEEKADVWIKKNVLIKQHSD